MEQIVLGKDLHTRLCKLFLANPPDSIEEVAKDMRITSITLKRFLRGNRPSYRTQLCLEKWIIEHE